MIVLQDAPSAGELVHISQCGGGAPDLLRMEAIILDKVGWELNAVTALTFLFIFYAMYEEKWPHLADTGLLGATIAKLEVCNSHYGFYGFQVRKRARHVPDSVPPHLVPSSSSYVVSESIRARTVPLLTILYHSTTGDLMRLQKLFFRDKFCGEDHVSLPVRYDVPDLDTCLFDRRHV